MGRTILSIAAGLMRSRSGLSGRIDKLLVRLHKDYENLDYDFYKNGEAAVLRKLADIQGFSTTTVFFSPDKSGVATCVPDFSEQFHKYEPQKIEARVSTGDVFCADHGIEAIDFLKIDVEGYEHKVLKGFEGMLKIRERHQGMTAP